MVKNTTAMLARNKLGSLILSKASEEEIAAQRVQLAAAILEQQIRTAMNAGVTHGKVAYIAKKISKEASSEVGTQSVA
ncbi:MAG TPA: hypothetical protein PLB92_00340 [Rhodoglobus sp.]|nr:hypothetical protein [Rhodoglobus sp.]